MLTYVVSHVILYYTASHPQGKELMGHAPSHPQKTAICIVIAAKTSSFITISTSL
jgi:hypothetical protein